MLLGEVAAYTKLGMVQCRLGYVGPAGDNLQCMEGLEGFGLRNHLMVLLRIIL